MAELRRIQRHQLTHYLQVFNLVSGNTLILKRPTNANRIDFPAIQFIRDQNVAFIDFYADGRCISRLSPARW